MSDLLQKTREICRLFEIKLSRTKGQNFLINEKIYDEIVAAADLKPDDVVIEVGPGLGFLTAKLSKVARQVIAVELDDKLAAYLKMGIEAQDVSNVKIVNQDILKFDLEAQLKEISPAPKSYKIVANLPYNITSVFLRLFLSGRNKPERLVLMLQKEVAERIVAAAPDMSLLAVSVQAYGEADIIRTVKAGNFWPEPKVDSAVIRIDTSKGGLLQKELSGIEEDKKFFRVVRVGFSAKRKVLKNNLVGGLEIDPKTVEDILLGAGLGLKVRAEDLSVQDWLKLFAALKPFVV